MQFAFSLLTGILWSVVAVLELTSLTSEPFWFSPIRTTLMALLGVIGLVIATTHYAWQLWFARASAFLILNFLVATRFSPLLPENTLHTPTLIALIIWLLFASFAGYEKRV